MSDSACDIAYHGIRQMLALGQFRPGERLSQSKLARQLGCSPMPVVEAMRRLESEGLLEKKTRKQATVRELSLEDLLGLFVIRAAIETQLARLAAEKITMAESAKLEELSRAYEQAWGDAEAEPMADRALHRHIAECGQHTLLQREYGRYQLIEITAGRHLRDELAKPATPQVHRALVQAVLDHDAESAAYLMKKHLDQEYSLVKQGNAVPRIVVQSGKRKSPFGKAK